VFVVALAGCGGSGERIGGGTGGDGDLIAFSRQATPSGLFQIYTIHRDGSHEKLLTDPANTNLGASLDHSGTKIVFASQRGGIEEIYKMKADGSNQVAITNLSGINDKPSWSPDGTKVVFDHSVGSGEDIFVVNIDGSGLTPLTSDEKSEFARFSPNGTKIVFDSTRTGGGEIWTMNADSTNQTQVTHHPGAGEACFSADGSKIFYSMPDLTVWCINVDGTNDVKLTPAGEADALPVASQDGQTIVFAHRLATGIYDICTMNVDGSNRQLVYHNELDSFYACFPSP